MRKSILFFVFNIAFINSIHAAQPAMDEKPIDLDSAEKRAEVDAALRATSLPVDLLKLILAYSNYTYAPHFLSALGVIIIAPYKTILLDHEDRLPISSVGCSHDGKQIVVTKAGKVYRLSTLTEESLGNFSYDGSCNGDKLKEESTFSLYEYCMKFVSSSNQDKALKKLGPDCEYWMRSASFNNQSNKFIIAIDWRQNRSYLFTAEGKMLHPFNKAEGGYNTDEAFFSPDDTKVLVAESKKIFLFDPETARLCRRFYGRHGSPAFSPDSKLVVSSGTRSIAEAITIFDLRNGLEWPVSKSKILSSRLAKFMSDDQHIVSTDLQGNVYTLDLRSGDVLSKCSIEPGVETRFNSDGAYIVTVPRSKFGKVEIWSVGAKRCLVKLSLLNQNSEVTRVSFGKDGDIIAATSSAAVCTWKYPSNIK